jgi:O-antigen ligase
VILSESPADVSQNIGEANKTSSLRRLSERLSFGLFLLALAWAPFPLGSNRPWSWSLLCIVISVSWLLWCGSVWAHSEAAANHARRILGPMVLGILALGWGAIQVLPFVPQTWAHPVWQLAGKVLCASARGTISMAPWRTETELMKLVTYAMTAWLAYILARRSNRASFLLNALIAIGALYAAYALVLASIGTNQLEILYGPGVTMHVVSGPFTNRNSYATYAGLITLCAGVRLVDGGWDFVAVARGLRRTVLALMEYLFGRGIPYLLAAGFALSSVIATGSRAGNFATITAIASLVLLSSALGVRQGRGGWSAGAAVAAFVCIAGLFTVSGDFLASRLNDITVLGLHDDTRLLLWNAAERMVHDSPFLGLGLGTYQSAYPLYSDVMLPFIMDKAHNDYLELAAGLGLAAALLWWTACVWLVGICVFGIYERKRNRLYAMLAVGASILVGVHSVFDFSLQIPAISLTYATILGIGVAQAFRTREQG